MTITLVEVDPSEPKPEMSFSKAVVRIGREAAESDVLLDGAKYPMVSRRHAELRCEHGAWMLHDLNSTYGVFLDGEKVGSPQPLGAGNRIQIGTDGPTLLVIWLDTEIEAPARKSPAQASPVAVSPPVATELPRRPQAQAPGSWEVAPPKPQASVPVQIPKASIEFLDTPQRPAFSISSSSTWIGRDPQCSIVIDSKAEMVSRKHAEIRTDGADYLIEDNKSFNGTLVNEQRISAVTPLYHDDRIRLGLGGPVLRFDSPGRQAPKGASLSGQRAVAGGLSGTFDKEGSVAGAGTMIIDRESAEKFIGGKNLGRPQLLMSVVFADKGQLTIGRDASNDIELDGLQISKRHARLLRSHGTVIIEDLKSTNGVYVNGKRVVKQQIGPHDAVQIGAFLITADAGGTINVFDQRSKTRIDVVKITRQVRDRDSGGQLALLDSISLSIQPNEFVGVLGPSGAGKSLLMHILNGSGRVTSGNVLINHIDLYQNLDSLKQSIGFVPQEDIIHQELTVYRSLYYVGKMRLSRDVSSAELRQIVEEVMDVTGLAGRRSVKVRNLSGGQRKRVSTAVELLTKPSVILLDEPTSGLDPAAEERIMKLFRQIAESGRTVVLTTHAMENVKLFDKIVVLMAGKLVFYGKPADALKHLNASSFKELYARLEEPVEEGVREHGEAHRRQITDRAAESWRTKFRSTPEYRENIEKPLGELRAIEGPVRQKKHRLGIFGSISQWFTLSRRYFQVLLSDKLTLFILLAQAPVIALMTFFVMGPEQPRDFVYFVLAIVAVWFGTSVSSREIIRERPVFERERMVNLGLLPYLASKLFVIGFIVSIQCLMLFIPLKLFDLAGLMSMPGELLGIPQLWAVLLTAAVGIALGLFVSAMVRTSEMATSLVPLILIPQILFSGLVGVPDGMVYRSVSMTMPAAWSFDTIKRFSTLDTLEPEGANPKGKTKGLGLYKYIEKENEDIVAKAKKDFEDYKRLNQGLSPGESTVQVATDLDSMSVKKIPDDLSGYVTFLHPWMNDVLNQIVLMLMFGLLTLATLIVLRLRDN